MYNSETDYQDTIQDIYEHKQYTHVDIYEHKQYAHVDIYERVYRQRVCDEASKSHKSQV